MSRTIKTVVHHYRYDMADSQQAAEYQAFADKLRGIGLKCFETLGSGTHYSSALNGKELELETKHLFDNQWNTRPLAKGKLGLRVFDWAQDYPIDFNKSIKRGYWLEQVPQMKAVRADRMACGYCGNQLTRRKAEAFCNECIGSEHLKAEDLHMLRMAPITSDGKRAKLTAAESARLLPIFKNAQMHGHAARDKARIARERLSVETEYRKTLEDAEVKYRGALLLMDAGIRTDNFIYYSHTKRWSLGWRNAISKDVVEQLKVELAEFPYAYDINVA